MFDVQFHIVTRCSPSSELNSAQKTSYQLFTDKQMSVVSYYYLLINFDYKIWEATGFLLLALQEDIAKERGLSSLIILNHLAMAMEAGYFVDYRRGKST